MRTARSAALFPLFLLALAGSLVADEPAATSPTPDGPTVAPSRRVDPAGLPPPVVRRPGERSALPPASPSRMQAPLPTTVPPVMEFQAPPPTGAQAPPSTSFSAPVPAPAATPSVPASGPAILDIVKNHNVPLADGTLALRLDVRFRADGAAGSAYRVWVHFHDNATGHPVRTTRPAFGDAQGALYVVTRPVQHGGGTAEYVAPLLIPYNVFPDPGAGSSIVVDATASLTLVEGQSEAPLGSSATNFRVHGPDAPAAPAMQPAAGFPAAR